LIPFVLVTAVNAAILWFLHDHYWYPSDEGIYAHIAQRLLEGDVLGRDIQSLHPGYINFVNAAAMRAFGPDLLSMRYPLVLAALIQSCLVYALFARHGGLLALAASVGSTALGLVQFLNPTAHWYCLALSVFLIWWLSVTPSGHWWRLLVTGALIGVVLLFRQLTGVWLAFGALAIILAEDPNPETREGTWMARVVLALAIVLLAAYLVLAGGSRPMAKLMVGSWPLMLLAVSLARARVPNGRMLRTTMWLTAGAAAAAAPLAGYLIAHGAVQAWLADALGALRLSDLDYMRTANWLSLAPLLGLVQLLRPTSVVSFVNGLYWFTLPLLPIINGLLTVRAFRQGSPTELALPVFAAFYALVSLHLEGSMYWYFSVGLSLAACLWHARLASMPARTAYAAAALGVAAIALVFHAGQPASRSFTDRMKGARMATLTPPQCDGLPHATLRIGEPDCETYRRIVELIRTHASADAPILAVPHDPEMYFLSDRRNPFRFYSTGVGIRGEQEFAEVLAHLAANPPAVVTYRPADKFNNDHSARIMTLVRQTHTRAGTFDGLEVYVRTGLSGGAGDRQE
jgi:hypothetical protein